MRATFSNGRPMDDAERDARLRMLAQRVHRLSGERGDRWVSPYTGFSYDTRAALDIEQLRGCWKKKMEEAWL